MNIRHLALTIPLAAGLALAACGGSDDDTQVVQTSAATTGASNNRGFTELQPGDTFTFTGDKEYPAEVNLRVDDINASKTCHNGVASYMDGTENPDSTFVQVSGDMDVKSNKWNDSFYITDGEWVAVDADGFTLEVTPASLCNTDQINTWSNPLDAGQKRHAVEEFEVKGTPVQWGVKPIRSDEGWGWKVGAPTTADSKAPHPTTGGAPEEAQPAPAADAPANSTGQDGYPLDPDVPGANQPYPGELTYDQQQELLNSDLGNAELADRGLSASTPNDCDGYLGAHEDPDESSC